MENIIMIIILIVIIAVVLLAGMLIGVNMAFTKIRNMAVKSYLTNDILSLEDKDINIECKVLKIHHRGEK